MAFPSWAKKAQCTHVGLAPHVLFHLTFHRRLTLTLTKFVTWEPRAVAQAAALAVVVDQEMEHAYYQVGDLRVGKVVRHSRMVPHARIVRQ